MIVLQEESTERITRALNTIKIWNPEVLPKYAFVDFDERKIVSLEPIYPNIEVYLCDFHREQAWNRWVNKAENGVANIADQVKVYRRCTAHLITHADSHLTVKNLMNADFCHERLKN